MPAPNIVLVTVDSLRADHVHGDLADTPAFDRLRDDGTAYTSAFAQGPFTTFSMPSLFTSRYPSGLQYVEFSDTTVGVYIDDEPTLPELLREQGYETAGFHSNPLLSNLFGFDRGFDTFDARLPFSNTDALPGRLKILTDKLLRLFRKHAYLPAERLNARALDWLDGREGDAPFFLWLHYMDVHGPYQPRSGNTYLNKYRSERLWQKAVKRPDELSDRERDRLLADYRAEIEYTDGCLGDLLDGLRTRGLCEETTVALTADHGEQFGEHGSYSHPHQLYDELTHVPLVVRDPEGPPERVTDIVELVDLTATLAERGGAPVPDSFAGEPLPDAPACEGDGAAISEADLVPAYAGSVRTDEWRYIRDEIAGREELYRMADDRPQQRDRAGEFPEVRTEFAERLDEHLSASHRSAGDGTAVASRDIADEDTEERLRDLGYLE